MATRFAHAKFDSDLSSSSSELDDELVLAVPSAGDSSGEDGSDADQARPRRGSPTMSSVRASVRRLVQYTATEPGSTGAASTVLSHPSAAVARQREHELQLARAFDAMTLPDPSSSASATSTAESLGNVRRLSSSSSSVDPLAAGQLWPSAGSASGSELNLRARALPVRRDSATDRPASCASVDSLPSPRMGIQLDLASGQMAQEVESLVIADIMLWLQQPVPEDAGLLQCRVIRQTSRLGLGQAKWHLYRQEDGKYLMTGQKRSGKATSNFLIAHDDNPTNRGSGRTLGKLRANMSGSMYVLYDAGLSPAKAATPAARRKELACIRYERGTLGPNVAQCLLPGQDRRAGQAAVVDDGQSTPKLARLAAFAESSASVFVLQSQSPRWSTRLQAHVLNFGGRVSQASVKNFQLRHVTPLASSSSASSPKKRAVALQFGRTGKDEFVLDFSWPLSPLQAFGVVLASNDPKLVDTVGADVLRQKFNKPGSN